MARIIPLTVGVERDLYEWVREQARRHGVSVSGWVRELFRAQRGPHIDPAALRSYRALYKRAAEAEGESSERFMSAERESWGEP